MEKEMRLEQFKTFELTPEEKREVEGGVVPPWIWQAAVGTFIYNVFGDWSENMAAFNQGRAAAR